MRTQLSIFDILPTGSPGVRRADPSTSIEAATANPVARGGQRRRVLETLEVLGTATDCQLATYTGILRGSAAKRRGELVVAGLVTRNGRGFTDTGSPAFTWSITDAGREALGAEHA